MTVEEKRLFSNLLVNHKHLWLALQESRSLSEHPGTDWETVHEQLHDRVDPMYQSVTDALLDDKPPENALRVLLRESDMTQAEVFEELKSR